MLEPPKARLPQRSTIKYIRDGARAEKTVWMIGKWKQRPVNNNGQSAALVLVRSQCHINKPLVSYCGRVAVANGRPVLGVDVFKRRIAELGNNEYELVGEYKGTQVPTTLLHRTCGRTFEVVPNNFTTNGNRCKHCKREQATMGIETLRRRIREQVGDEYTLLSERYVNNETKVAVRHNVCDHEYLVTPGMFLNKKRRCPRCSKRERMTTESFKERVKAEVGDEYVILGEYRNIDSPVLARHEVCGHEYMLRPNDFLGLRKRRCPYCNLRSKDSRDVKRIRGILKASGLDFREEVRMDSCTLKRQLLFDFFIPDLRAVIEYDGKQHFEPVWGGDVAFRNTLARDEAKNGFVARSSLILLRIPHTIGTRLEILVRAFLKFNDQPSGVLCKQMVEETDSILIVGSKY